jgi:hypothetical protein
MAKKKKRKSRREKAKHPDLDKKYNLKTRQDLLDYDYLDKLDKKSLDWLNKFNKEFVVASLDTENPKKNLHKNKKLIKDCFDRNNARNRDILTRAKASNQLTDYELLINETNNLDYEDSIIEKIDHKEALEAIEWLASEINKDDQELEVALIKESEDKVKP